MLQHEDGVTHVVFSPDGRRLVTANAAGRSGTTHLVDTNSGKELAILQHGDGVSQANFSPDGRRLAIAIRDGRPAFSTRRAARSWSFSNTRICTATSIGHSNGLQPQSPPLGHSLLVKMARHSSSRASAARS